MLRTILLTALTALVTLAEARVPARGRKPMAEAGGKVNVILADQTALGLAAEVVVNPFPRLGLRYEFFDARYQDPVFSVSLLGPAAGNLDALVYLPMSGFEPYIHAGIGLSAGFGSGSTQWTFGFRCGLGLRHALSKQAGFFAETGILFDDATGAGSSTAFRLSAGLRFGLIR